MLTAPVVFGRLHVLPVVADFLKRYPDIDMRLVHLLEDQVDYASAAYLGEHGTPATPAELAAHACIIHEQVTSRQVWTFGSGKSEVTVPIRSRLAVSTAEAAVDAAVAGIGLTRVLPYQMAGALDAVLQAFESPPLPVSLVHAGQRIRPLKLRVFLDFAAARLKARLAALPAIA